MRSANDNDQGSVPKGTDPFFWTQTWIGDLLNAILSRFTLIEMDSVVSPEPSQFPVIDLVN